MREGLDETARSLSDAASDGRGGMTGAFGGVLRWQFLVHQGKNWKQWISLQGRSKHDGETDYSWCCGVEQPLGWNEESDKVKIQIWHFFKNHHAPFAVPTSGQRKRTSGGWADVGGIPFQIQFLPGFVLGGISSWNPAPAYSWSPTNNNSNDWNSSFVVPCSVHISPSHNMASTKGISYQDWTWSLHIWVLLVL